MQHRAATPSDADAALRRELYFLTLFRLLEAALLALLMFGPGELLSAEPRHPTLAAGVALAYLFAATLLFALGRSSDLQQQALVGVLVDLALALTAIHAIPSAGTGISLMLVFNVAAASLLLPTRLAMGVAALSAAGVIGEFAVSHFVDTGDPRRFGEPVMFALAFAGSATLTQALGRQMRESYELASARGADVAQLSELNELIIRRLPTGVLVVDGQDRLRLANEAGMLLLGDDGDPVGEQHHRNLAIASPALARRLADWRATGRADNTPMQLSAGMPEVVPRFNRLLAGSEQVLVFLDDTSLLSRHAESLTLATLGRFSASLAHEIRNPLAAINYAVQLLEESTDIAAADRRLLEIIHQQGNRMNGIVENVLGLARREPAKAEPVELVAFARRFIEDYAASHPLENDTLRATSVRPTLNALVDPRQLHQVVTALVHNALLYGRMPGQPARVTLQVYADDVETPVLEVLDRGPGIPDSVASQLFRPFFTTSGHGTGLGLYIARELCRANQATLEYVPVPAGGGCFRIRLSPPNALLRS
ncbi:MAG: ATP-binding protein [Pseudomonas sp.]|nr:ATP-binding protein [Pseudomonas sp.]